jgi:nitrogen fixation-related uncharacterized protein
MGEATIAITVMSGLIGAIFLGFLLWGFFTGQFHNVQDASRRMLQNNVQSPPDIPPDEHKKKTKSGQVKGGDEQ